MRKPKLERFGLYKSKSFEEDIFLVLYFSKYKNHRTKKMVRSINGIMFNANTLEQETGFYMDEDKCRDFKLMCNIYDNLIEHPGLKLKLIKYGKR